LDEATQEGRERLRTGIIGVGGYGGKVLAELGRNENFLVQAIGDQDKDRAQEYAQQYEARWYDDYRSLIVEEKLDVLFLALPNFLCGECLDLAVKTGVHVFKEAPLARSLPEAMQWVERMEKTERRFQIGARRRFAPGYLAAHRILEKEELGLVYLVRGEYFLHYPEQRGAFDWRGDPVLAGGGVLLEESYHLIDQIVWSLGLPEKLYSLNTNKCSKQVLPPYRTEDTATVTMKFADGAVGNLLCSWMTGPSQERLLVHGTEGSLEAGANYLRRYEPGGKVIKEDRFEVDDAWMIGQQVRQFGDSLRDADLKPISTAREHIPNVAIVEAAYLSARTQLPETLKVYGSLFQI